MNKEDFKTLAAIFHRSLNTRDYLIMDLIERFITLKPNSITLECLKAVQWDL